MSNRIQLTRDTRTTPPTNLGRGADPEMFDALLVALLGRHQKIDERVQQAGLSLIKYHQGKLGKQDYCWTGEFRFWIWDRIGYRLFISNLKGISFEVPLDASVQDAQEALDVYLRELGA